MKKLICLIAVSAILTVFCIIPARADHAGIHKTEDADKIKALQLLEVVHGDLDGNLNLDAAVTRAEFVKMVLCISNYKNEADSSSASSVFPDVPNDHWAKGYISVSVSKGLVTGYLNGTFRPENNVKLEEAVIILLKLLGYTNADFVGTYPEAQLSKYDEIGLDTEIDAARGEILTRNECMKLIYNTLCTKTKNNAYYCTTLGYPVNSDNTVDYLSLLSNKMKGPFVNDGNLQSKLPFSLDRALIMYDGKEITKSELEINDVVYYADEIDTMWVFKDKVSGVCVSVLPSRENPSSVMLGSKQYSLSTPSAVYKFSNYGSLKEDTLVTLLLGKDGSCVDAVPAGLDSIGNDEGDVSYAEVVSATLKGPFISDASGVIPKNSKVSDNAEIYKNGKTSSVSEIKKNNVYYYSELLDTLWFYDSTASGTVEAISPTRVSPSSVTVSGKTYLLEGADAEFAFSSLGAYDVGDRVTLLLGKDSGAAGVLDAGSVINEAVYGVVIENGEKQYKDKDGKSYTADYITVFGTDSGVYTYEYGGSVSVGDAVCVSVTSDKTSVTKLNKPKSVSQAVQLNNAVREGKFAPDAQIIEYCNKNLYGTVVASRISGLEIWYSKIAWFELDDSGAVKRLILENYTGDLLTYGLLTKIENSSYTYRLDGEEIKYRCEEIFSVKTGPAYFEMSGNTISTMGNISANAVISSVSGNKAYTSKGDMHIIADDVIIYLREGADYKAYGINDVDLNNYSLVGYYDDVYENGGRIRIITAY